MSSRPKLDATALESALRDFTREGRVRLIDAAARSLIESGTREGLFTGGAILAWLESSGDLAKDYFKVTRPKSHMTISRLWRMLEDERLGSLIGDEGAKFRVGRR